MITARHVRRRSRLRRSSIAAIRQGRGPIQTKDAVAVERMSRAGEVVARTLQRLERAIKPGVSPVELDAIALNVIQQAGATPSFLGHNGFPANICVAVNDAVVHGIPDARVLADGDLISVDIGAIVDGYHADAAWTFSVGSVTSEGRKLLAAGERALNVGIEAARAGHRLGAISHAIQQSTDRERGMSLIQQYGGHGIGRCLWEEPHVPNVGDPSDGFTLRSGLALAIEPMLTLGSGVTRLDDDGWTVRTVDQALCVHFEHTVIVSHGSPLILTDWASEVVN